MSTISTNPTAVVPRLARGRVHYAWIVAGVTFLALLAAASIRSAPGVLIVPLEQEFHWSRATISLAVSVNLLTYGLCGPFAAALMERFGGRRTLALALSLVALGVGATTVMRAAWQMVALWGLVVGMGTGSMTMALGAMVSNRWFLERRGLVMGALTASAATGQLLFLPAMASLIVSLGWRTAVLFVAGVALLVIPFVAVLMRDNPAELGLLPFGARAAEPEAAPRTHVNPIRLALGTLRKVLPSAQFWLIAGSYFTCGASTNGLVGTHLIPAAIDHGIPEVTAASMLAVMGIFIVTGTTASGWLSDRVDNRLLLCGYYAVRGLMLFYWPSVFGNPLAVIWLFAVVYGLDWVTTVPPTARLTADVFGKRNVGVVVGWIFAIHQLGAAAAALGAGMARTWLGDYQVAFMTSGLLCLIAAGLVIRIRPGPATDPTSERPLERSPAFAG